MYDKTVPLSQRSFPHQVYTYGWEIPVILAEAALITVGALPKKDIYDNSTPLAAKALLAGVEVGIVYGAYRLLTRGLR